MVAFGSHDECSDAMVVSGDKVDTCLRR
jgi:hypothetical protein